MLETLFGKSDAIVAIDDDEQVRIAKETALAAISKLEQLEREEQALLRINPQLLEQLMVPTLSPQFRAEVLAVGLPASPGAASGKIVFDADTAERLAEARARYAY